MEANGSPLPGIYGQARSTLKVASYGFFASCRPLADLLDARNSFGVGGQCSRPAAQPQPSSCSRASSMPKW
jgi:hypothetical protein